MRTTGRKNEDESLYYSRRTSICLTEEQFHLLKSVQNAVLDSSFNNFIRRILLKAIDEPGFLDDLYGRGTEKKLVGAGIKSK